jgi:predicted RNase H-like nuclease (RuvC/YqgF family)
MLGKIALQGRTQGLLQGVSAQEICERVAALKENTEYADSMKEADGEGKLELSRDPEQGADESVARDLSENVELIETERQNFFNLQETLAAKEKEIEELKKQLAGDSAPKEQQPSQSEKGWLYIS